MMPVDPMFSPATTLQQARGMLRGDRERWKVLLLGTFRGPFLPAHRSVAIHDELKRKTLERLATRRDEIRDRNHGENADFELWACMGSLENAIDFLSQERQVDCLLLDTELGSHREDLGRLLSRVTFPVLMIPSVKQP